MKRSPDTKQLIECLHTGDNAGVELLFQLFASRLVYLAREHIATYYQNRVDPEDVVQSVFKSFLVRYRKDQVSIESGEGLWGLLTVITVRKCADRIEHFRAECRDVRREVPLMTNHAAAVSSIARLDREPTPDEACVLSETVEQLLRGFDSADRPIVQAYLQGSSTSEISNSLCRAERSVRRIRSRIRQQLVKQLADTGVRIHLTDS